MTECTFRPKTNGYVVSAPDEQKCKNALSKEYRKLRKDCANAHKTEQLYNYAQKAKTKKDEINQNEEESLVSRQMKDCTFKPKLTEYNGQGLVHEMSQGQLKEVERMRQAREQQEIVKSMLERGYNYPNNMPPQASRSNILSYASKYGDEESVQYGEPENDSADEDDYPQQDDEANQNEPLVTVDINLPEGVDQIVIYPGDSIDALAEEFALKHNLNSDKAEKLVTMLNSELEEGLQETD